MHHAPFVGQERKSKHHERERDGNEQHASQERFGQSRDQADRQRRAPVEDAVRRVAARGEFRGRGVVVGLAGMDASHFGGIQVEVTGATVGGVGKTLGERRERDCHKERGGEREQRERDQRLAASEAWFGMRKCGSGHRQAGLILARNIDLQG